MDVGRNNSPRSLFSLCHNLGKKDQTEGRWSGRVQQEAETEAARTGPKEIEMYRKVVGGEREDFFFFPRTILSVRDFTLLSLRRLMNAEAAQFVCQHPEILDVAIGKCDHLWRKFLSRAPTRYAQDAQQAAGSVPRLHNAVFAQIVSTQFG